jgi:hypothetical protein
VLVVFTADMRVEQAWRIPREVVNELASDVPHVNGLRIALATNVTAHPDLRDSSSTTVPSTRPRPHRLSERGPVLLLAPQDQR